MLLRWIVFVGVLCCIRLIQTPARADTLQDVLDILLQCQTTYYRLEDYQGTLRRDIEGRDGSSRQETLEVVFRKPGFLSVRWQSGLYKGTTLLIRPEVNLIRPEVNPGNVLIRLGEGFDYVTVNAPATEVGEPFTPGLKDLNEWLTALVLLAQRPVTDRSLRSVEVRHPSPQDPDGRFILSVPAFLIPFRDNSVAAYEFAIERGTGIPMELALRGAGGEVLQRMVYTSLHINTGVGVQAFRGAVHGDGSSPVSDETSVDLRGFTQSWQRRYGEILDYSGTWNYETPKEGGSGEVNHSEIVFKFRKPFDLYLHWGEKPGATQEALFRQGRNEGRVRIRTSWKGVPLIGDVAPDGYLARWGGRPQVTEFGFNRLVERLQEQLLRGWLREELKVRFLGVQECNQRPCYGLEFLFSRGQQREYPAVRIVTYWDVEERIPVRYESFDGHDCGDSCLVERHRFSRVQINNSLNDLDFDPGNAAYGFLLFRQAPRLDRFLTGRD